jgi:hypothetical protein
MILIREKFTAKPGMAGKLSKIMLAVQKEAPAGTVKVMTDLTGTFHTVVIETEIASLAEFEKRMQEYGANVKLREIMAGYNELYVTGERQIFQVLG